MPQAVSFAAMVKVTEAVVYVMGGFHDYSTTDVMQKYDLQQNSWEKMRLRLPVKLAKMGAARLNDKEILICGGIYENHQNYNPFSLISNTYKFNHKTNRWSKGMKMRSKRTTHSSLCQHDNRVYVLGSTTGG